LLNACDKVFDDIQTSLSMSEIVDLASNIALYDLQSTTGFPFDLTTKDLEETGSTVVPINLKKNVADLHNYLYNVEDYEPSETVKEISERIMYSTEVYDSELSYNMDNYNNIVGADGTDSIESFDITDDSSLENVNRLKIIDLPSISDYTTEYEFLDLDEINKFKPEYKFIGSLEN
jgi:hypothetical protein